MIFVLRVGIKPASMYEKNRIVEVFFIHDRAEICNMYLYTLILIHAVKIIKIIFTLTIIMTSLFFIIQMFPQVLDDFYILHRLVQCQIQVVFLG